MIDIKQPYSKLVGAELSAARNKQQLTQSDITSILKIKRQIIDMLENDTYPSQEIDVFIKGHLISYCRFLRINAQNILNKLEAKGYNLPVQDASDTQEVEESAPVKRKGIYIAFVSIILFSLLVFRPAPVTNKQSTNITQPIRYGAE